MLATTGNSSLSNSTDINLTFSRESSEQMIPCGNVRGITPLVFGSRRKLSRATTTRSARFLSTFGSDTLIKSTSTSSISKDRVDIALIERLWREELDNWYEEKPDSMKSSVFHLSKSLAKDVNEAREKGFLYLTFKFTENMNSFKLNIGPSSTVDNTHLTKVRFFAIVLRYLHEAAQRESDPESKGFTPSALVSRVEFDQGNPLYKYRFLLGEGFHLNHDLFESEDQRNLFLLGCILLDFLSCHSSKSPRYGSCKHIKTFVEYVRSSVAKQGDTLLAGMRHGSFTWGVYNGNLFLLEARARLFKIQPYRTPSIQMRLDRGLRELRK